MVLSIIRPRYRRVEIVAAQDVLPTRGAHPVENKCKAALRPGQACRVSVVRTGGEEQFTAAAVVLSAVKGSAAYRCAFFDYLPLAKVRGTVVVTHNRLGDF